MESLRRGLRLFKSISFRFKDLDTYIKKTMLAMVPYRFKPLHTY